MKPAIAIGLDNGGIGRADPRRVVDDDLVGRVGEQQRAPPAPREPDKT